MTIVLIVDSIMDQFNGKNVEKYENIKENSEKDGKIFKEQFKKEYFVIQKLPEENCEKNKILKERSEKYKINVNLGIPGRIEKFFYNQKVPEKHQFQMKQAISENEESESFEKQVILKTNEDDQNVDEALSIAEKLRKYCRTVKFFQNENKIIKSPGLSQIKRSELNIEKINGKFKLRQPFKILTDIWGVLTSYEFRYELFKYIDDNIESYLNKNIRQSDVQTYLEELIKRTEIDVKVYPEMPPIINDGDEQTLIKSMVDNIKFRHAHKTDRASLMQYLDWIFNLIWNDG